MFSDLEKEVFKKYSLVAGVDEAGRGCLAGPVAAAIVVVSNEDFKAGKFSGFCNKVGLSRIRDSKQLSAIQREKIFEHIQQEPLIGWRVSFVSPRVIDRINIWQATLMACRKCLNQLNVRPDYVFLDGKMGMPRLKIEQAAVVGGDAKIFILSLASIIAKVSRDRLMEKTSRQYRGYGLCRHKGYGTELHLKALAKMGPTKIHRKSFKPVFDNLPFKEKIYFIVKQIPKGEVMTYKGVAERAGHPGAYRAVGNVLHRNFDLRVPCHRVVRSDGKLGGYNRGENLKRELLMCEGAIA